MSGNCHSRRRLAGVRSELCVVLMILGVGFSLIASGGAAAGNSVQMINGITRNLLGSVVLLQGTISDYKAPRSARSPHSFMLRDSTGVIRIVIWQNLWAGIPFNDKLKVDGQQITMRAEVAEYQNAIEGHLRAPGEIALGTTIPPESSIAPDSASVTPSPNLSMQGASSSPSSAAASGVVLPGGVVVPTSPSGTSGNPMKIEWQTNITEAQAEARRLGRKILIFFYVPGESTGELALAGVFSDSALSSTVATEFVPLQINPRQHPGFKNTGVAPGSYAVYTFDGRPEKTIPPVKSAAELANALK